MDKLFYTNTDNLLRILATIPLMYLLAIVYIRVVGKRATSQMNNFDWIVTVAMGSIVASTIILPGVSLADGGVSILTLLLLQYGLTKTIYRHQELRSVIKSTPQLLLYEGEFLRDNMRSERVIEAEVYAAIRRNGLMSVDQVYAVILETDASLSVIPTTEDDDLVGFSLGDVGGLPEGLRQDLEKRGEHDDTPTGKTSHTTTSDQQTVDDAS